MPFKDQIEIASVSVLPVFSRAGVSPSMALGTMPTRPALLIRMEDTQGCFGWGEIWANFPPRANLHKAHLVEDVVEPILIGATFTEPVEVTNMLRKKQATYFLHIGQTQVFEHILAGLDMALWDLALRSAGQSFAAHFSLKDARAQCYASSINRPDLERLLPAHAALGQKAFKLKVGLDHDADIAFLRNARSLRPADTALMIDSNQSWTADSAAAFLSECEEFDLLFAEEPIPADASLAEWTTLARQSPVPLAVGENVYGIDGFLQMVDCGVRYVQPDVAKWGGLSGALALAERLPNEVQLWPHYMGTAVGQIAALSVSAAIGKLSTCEMDVNVNPLRSDLCGDVLGIKAGEITLPNGPGLTLPPLAEQLAVFSGEIS